MYYENLKPCDGTLKIRSRVKALSNTHLWVLFDIVENCEKTGEMDSSNEVLDIATTYLFNDTKSIRAVISEIWRELAIRGIGHTL